jgi:hypothetical protein
MARKKLEKIPAVDSAVTRSAALASIDPKLDLGKGLTLIAYDTQIQKVRDRVKAYNTGLSMVDNLYDDIFKEIDVLNDLHERLLAGVGSAYGFDSNEYEMAGGVRKSEKKKPVRKPKK